MRLALVIESVSFGLLLIVVAYAPLAQGSLTLETEFGLKVGVALILVLLGVRFLFRHPWVGLGQPKPILTALATGYLATVLLSALLSPYPLGSLREAARIAVHVIGFFLAASLAAGAVRRNLLVFVLMLTSVAMALVGLLQIAGYPLLPTTGGGRISSTYFNPVHFSGFLDLVAPLALAAALFAPRLWQRFSAGLVALLLYFNAIFTFSFASWGCLAVVTLILLVVYAFRPRPSRRRLTVAAGLLGLSLIAGLMAIYASPRLDGTLGERVKTVFQVFTAREGSSQSPGPLGSLIARTEIWNPTVTIVFKNPALGVGPGNFIYTITRFRPELTTAAKGGLLHRFVNYAHHDYLQVASETGVLSAMLFAGFWLLVLLMPAPGVPLWFSVGTRLGIFALVMHGFMDGNLTVNHSVSLLAFTVAGALQTNVSARPASSSAETIRLTESPWTDKQPDF